MNIDWSKSRAEPTSEYAGGKACSTRQTLSSIRREAMQGTLQYLAAGSPANIITPSLVAAPAGPATLPKASSSKSLRRKTKRELELLEKLYAEARYPSSEAKERVCRETSLTLEQIKHWLYRRRQRDDRRQSASTTSSASETSETPLLARESGRVAPSAASTYFLLHHICGQPPPASPSSDSVSSVGFIGSARSTVVVCT